MQMANNIIKLRFPALLANYFQTLDRKSVERTHFMGIFNFNQFIYTNQ